MKKLALLATVVFTTLTVHSCRQADDFLTNEEAATLQKVQDSSKEFTDKSNVKTDIMEVSSTSTLEVDGEIVIPPKK